MVEYKFPKLKIWVQLPSFSFNENIKGMLPVKQAEKAYYKQFSEFLNKYEETRNKT